MLRERCKVSGKEQSIQGCDHATPLVFQSLLNREVRDHQPVIVLAYIAVSLGSQQGGPEVVQLTGESLSSKTKIVIVERANPTNSPLHPSPLPVEKITGREKALSVD
jgi:hypothetical protein